MESSPSSHSSSTSSSSIDLICSVAIARRLNVLQVDPCTEPLYILIGTLDFSSMQAIQPLAKQTRAINSGLRATYRRQSSPASPCCWPIIPIFSGWRALQLQLMDDSFESLSSCLFHSRFSQGHPEKTCKKLFFGRKGPPSAPRNVFFVPSGRPCVHSRARPIRPNETSLSQ